MANSLPMTLRVYRRLSAAVVPLAPALIKRRLKHGKEDPARIGERRGMSRDVRPHGPLVWIHGASVGEVLAAAALIERAAGAQHPHPADLGHGDLGGDRRQAVSRRHHPSICARTTRRATSRAFSITGGRRLALFIESDLWPNLILSSAARRLPMVLINGRMSQRSFPRWRRVTGTISALLGRFDVCLAQSEVDAERFAALGSRNVVTTGNLKLDVAGAAGRSRQAGAADGGDARPSDRGRGLDPSRRRGHPAGSAPDACGILPVAVDRDRAAASRSRRSDRPHASRLPGCMRRCARARSCRRRPPTSTSPTPWANSDCSIGWRRSCSWADRWSSMAGRIRSRRSSSAPRSCTARTSSISPTSTRRSTPPAARGRPTRWKRW